MRVGVVHNMYQHRGGEERVVEIETALLRSHGHHVGLQCVDSREVFASLGSTLRSMPKLACGWNTAIGHRLANWATEQRFDVVHFHNIYPVITPAAVRSVREAGVPVVMTLHNFRPLCANGTAMRDGADCNRCSKGCTANAIRFGCYRGSRVQSTAWAIGATRADRHAVWHHSVDRFIAPSDFVRDMYLDAGFQPDLVTVRPHAVPDTGIISGQTCGAVIVGRIDHGKGVLEVARRWSTNAEKLKIVGVGPELDAIRALGRSNIECFGRCEADRVAEVIAGSRLLLQPSMLRETFGLTIAEAAAAGRPSIAFDRAGPASIIDHGMTGQLVPAGSFGHLVDSAVGMLANPARCKLMGKRARDRYERLYGPEAGYLGLMSVYRSVIGSKSGRVSA